MSKTAVAYIDCERHYAVQHDGKEYSLVVSYGRKPDRHFAVYTNGWDVQLCSFWVSGPDVHDWEAAHGAEEEAAAVATAIMSHAPFRKEAKILVDERQLLLFQEASSG